MYQLDKVNSYGLNFQSKCGILRKSKKLFEYHPTSIQTPKSCKRNIYTYTYTYTYKGEALLQIFIEAMREV